MPKDCIIYDAHCAGWPAALESGMPHDVMPPPPAT